MFIKIVGLEFDILQIYIFFIVRSLATLCLATVWNRSFSEEKEPKRLPAILTYRMGCRSQEPCGLFLGPGVMARKVIDSNKARHYPDPKVSRSPFTKNGHGMRSIPESFFGSFCSQKEQYPPVANEQQ
ncbi:MAG: hypothetical protein K2K83_01145 [Rikenella sp.]|nr:hypothetical protein [Rikenella sp.]